MSDPDAATEATSRFAQGSVRNEFLREAESQVYVSGGTVSGGVAGRDYISGDFIVVNMGAPDGTGARAWRLTSVSERMMRLVRGAFVEPEGWIDIIESGGRHRVVILRGSAGRGRFGCGLKLMQELAVEHVYYLDSITDLDRLPGALSGLPMKSGFVLAVPLDQSVLTAGVLRSVAEALDTVDGRLVIAAGGGPFGDDDVLEYVVPMVVGADVRRLVERHLEHHLGHRRAEQALAQVDVRDLIDDLLRDEAPCSMAALIADELARAYGEKIDVAVVRKRITEHSNDEFDIWFDTLGDVDTRCFAIALAVLNGLPYEKVAQAARQLRAKLGSGAAQSSASTAVTPRSTAASPGDPFRISRGRRLELLRARVERVTLLQPYGRVPAEAVSYIDWSFAEVVLRRAWESYQIQNVLLEWLGDLITDVSEQLRIRAGLALGKLAVLSFDYVNEMVFVRRTYADDDNSSKWRDAIAYALRVAAEDKALHPVVARVVGGWYADNDNPQAQACAARAYGLSLGRSDPAGAVDALERLAMINDIRVARAIGDSLSDLLATDPGRMAAPVVGRLTQWFDSLKRHLAGQLIFLILASSLLAPADEAAGRPSDWPMLLMLLVDHADLRDPLIELWRQVIVRSDFHDQAEQVMGTWAGLAEADGPMRETFTRMLRAIANQDERARAILLRYAAKWHSDENLQPLPRTADAIRWALEATRGAL